MFIRTYNREDCCKDRLSNYEVRVGDDKNLFNNPACPGVHEGGKLIRCNLDGKYVGIYIRGEGYLTLCEVEMFGF